MSLLSVADVWRCFECDVKLTSQKPTPDHRISTVNIAMLQKKQQPSCRRTLHAHACTCHRRPPAAMLVQCSHCCHHIQRRFEQCWICCTASRGCAATYCKGPCAGALPRRLTMAA